MPPPPLPGQRERADDGNYVAAPRSALAPNMEESSKSALDARWPTRDARQSEAEMLESLKMAERGDRRPYCDRK